MIKMMIGGKGMKKILKNLDKPLLMISILLFAIGLVMIFSSSNIIAFMQNGVSPYRYFIKQSIVLLISLVFSFILIRFKTKVYGPFAWFFVIAITGMLLSLFIYGSVKNQSISWFDLGFFSIQPSEFAKLIMIAWMATYYDTNRDKLSSYVVSLFPLVVAVGIMALIFVQPDAGTAFIFTIIVAFLFLITPIPNEIKLKTVLLGLGAILVAGIVILGSGRDILLGRQKDRFDFLDPCSKYTEPKGYQICNGYIAINNGGALGVGLGNSTQKYLYLPEAHTDSIFAIVMEELGLIGGISIFVLYFLLLGRIVKIGRESYTDRGALICYGVAMYIFAHIAVNLLGLFGLIPLTGVPLPFMSYGGSFAMVLILALTMVQRVNVETRLREEAPKKNARVRK